MSAFHVPVMWGSSITARWFVLSATIPVSFARPLRPIVSAVILREPSPMLPAHVQLVSLMLAIALRLVLPAMLHALLVMFLPQFAQVAILQPTFESSSHQPLNVSAKAAMWTQEQPNAQWRLSIAPPHA